MINRIFGRERYRNNANHIKKLAKSHFEIGVIKLVKENQALEAATNFLKALELNPEASDFPKVYSQLADCYNENPASIENSSNEIHANTLKVFFERLQAVSKQIIEELDT